MTVKLVGAPRYYGTNSERVAFTEEIHRGSIWVETDTEEIYCYTGTIWAAITIGGAIIPDHAHEGVAGDGGRIDTISISATEYATMTAFGSLQVRLGDAAGSEKLQILDSGAAIVATINSNGKATFWGSIALISTALRFDTDEDTYFWAAADDILDLYIGGLLDFTFGANKLTLKTGSVMELEGAGCKVDLNGVADALILDADGDLTLSAAVDDEALWEVGGGDVATWKAGGLYFEGGKEIYPNDENYGLYRRLINQIGLTAWTAHFRAGETTGPGNGSLAAYAWQGAPLGGVPAAVLYAYGNEYMLATDIVTGTKHLLSKAITNAAASWQNKSLYARIRTGTTTEIGLRFDSNDNNNWVEIYVTGVLADATYRLDFRYMDNGVGPTTVTSNLIIPVGGLITIRLLCVFAAATYTGAGYVVTEGGQTVNITGFSHVLTGNWAAGPPAVGRAGIMVKNAGNYGAVDWFYDEFT